jgi:predicted metal-binding protein
VSEGESSIQATILVCITCRDARDCAESPAHAGLALAEATLTAACNAPDIAVKRVRCLGNCSRGPSVAIRCDHSWTYLFGGLQPAVDGPALIAGARLLVQANDGLMPWRRPEALKRNLIARVPPADFPGDPA